MTNSKHHLYEEYSAHFARGKTYCPELQYSIYEDVYRARISRLENLAILDLGCGKGEWLSWLRQQGAQHLTGVDLSNDVRHGPDGITLVQSDVFDFLQQEGPSYDIIHAKDLIEHLTAEEALAFCQAALKRLRPQGELWLLTFNAQAPFASATRYSDLTHKLGLTPESGSQLLRASGYVDVRFEGIHPCPRTFKGKLRKLLNRPVAFFSRALIVLRHGGRGGYADCSPDIFLRGRRAEEEAGE